MTGAGRTVVVTPPGSKSMTNRALLLAALARGESEIRGALTDADDARVMIDALRALGAAVGVEGTTLRVRGVGGRFPIGVETRLNLENAGTATRFLCAAALLADAPVVIDGNARMRERPIGALAGALESLGAKVEWLGARGCPPLRITPPAAASMQDGSGAARPREITLPTTSSGQFVSALALVGALLPGGLAIRIDGEVTSPPYIEMTLRMLRLVGAEAEWGEDLRWMRVGAARGGALAGRAWEIEPDASGAGYFWGAAALTPGLRCETPGIGGASLQGDARFAHVLGEMGALVEQSANMTRVRCGGALRGIDADLSPMPDAAMTLAVVACFAEGPTTIRGLRTLRVKETDRLAALQKELGKIGARVEVIGGADDPVLRITPSGEASGSEGVEFETYDDHRMAMALSLVTLRRSGVVIRDPGCVRKTYPGYWADWAKIAGGSGKK